MNDDIDIPLPREWPLPGPHGTQPGTYCGANLRGLARSIVMLSEMKMVASLQTRLGKIKQRRMLVDLFTDIANRSDYEKNRDLILFTEQCQAINRELDRNRTDRSRYMVLIDDAIVTLRRYYESAEPVGIREMGGMEKSMRVVVNDERGSDWL